MRLSGKTAVVTGAGAGIGKQTATSFACEGARVLVSDIDSHAAARVAEEIRASGGDAAAACLDVTQEEQVDSIIGNAARRMAGIDVLVSNAGIQHLDEIAELTFENWTRVPAVHLDGGFLTSRACMRHMRDQGRGGSIILIRSAHSHSASTRKGPYVVAKHGLVGLARIIAKEGAKYGIRTNTICPDLVRTAFVERQVPALAKEYGVPEDQVMQEVFLRHTVDGEYTTPADIADVAVFLASFPSNALTGQSVCPSHGSVML